MKNTSSLLFRQKRLAYRTSKKKSDNTFTNMRHNQSTEGSKRAEFLNWVCPVSLHSRGEECVCVCSKPWLGSTVFQWELKTIRWAPQVITNSKIWHCIYCVFPLISVVPQTNWAVFVITRDGNTATERERESTKICDRVFGVTYALRSRHSDIEEDDITERNVLVWCRHKQAITGHTGAPCSRCVQKSHKDTEEEVGHVATEILSVLQKYSRPVVVVVGEVLS